MLIDITPAIVNKTAVYRMIKDVIAGCTGLFSGLIKCGNPFELSEGFNGPLPKIMRMAIRFPGLFLFLRNFFFIFLPTSKESILFFDPLYLLFYGVLPSCKVFILDMTPMSHPHWHGKNISKLYMAAFKEVVHGKHQVIAISQSTANEASRLLHIPSDQIHLIYLYSDFSLDSQLSKTQKQLKKQILFVGSFEQRKNLIGLIEGFQKFKSNTNLNTDEFELHIVGAKTQHYFENADKLKIKSSQNNDIYFWGYLSDEDLEKRYNEAYMFAYPSFWEGFGIPLLEAMKMGIPCFASSTGACPEVGGINMIYVNPENTDQIADAIRQLAIMSEEARLNYITYQFAQAEKFSKQKFLNEIIRKIQ
jgi:glycosyltransferase involved in cell wall biosynthesis